LVMWVLYPFLILIAGGGVIQTLFGIGTLFAALGGGGEKEERIGLAVGSVFHILVSLAFAVAGFAGMGAI